MPNTLKDVTDACGAGRGKSRSRTTLSLEDDALELARELARVHKLSLGQAVSALIRRGARRPLLTDERSGLLVARLPEGSPCVTAEDVDRWLDELA